MFQLMMGRMMSEGMEKDFGAGERAGGIRNMYGKIKRKMYDEGRINPYIITTYTVIRVYVRSYIGRRFIYNSLCHLHSLRNTPSKCHPFVFRSVRDVRTDAYTGRTETKASERRSNEGRPREVLF